MNENQNFFSVSNDSKGHVKVTVFDAELLDFIEDYLIEECNIDYKYFTKDEESQNVFVMYLPKKYKLTEIKKHLDRLEKNELKRIYELNN